MKKAVEEHIYLSEKSKELFPDVDFADTFSTINNVNTLREIANLIFNNYPMWISILFQLRNKLVKIFGLKTTMPPDYNENYEIGGYISFFKIIYIDDNEIIMGANDKHLNFRAIIYRTNENTNNIKVTTLVKFNNPFGKIYMSIVKPFHKLVLLKMVAQAYSK